MADTLDRSETRNLISSSKVEGTTVYSIAGDRLGTIRNFMVDKFSGKADYAVLEFGGFLGLGSDNYPVPWEKLSYDTDKGGYVVDISKKQLEGAPRYGSEEAPEYTDEYGRTVYGYYGVSYPYI